MKKIIVVFAAVLSLVLSLTVSGAASFAAGAAEGEAFDLVVQTPERSEGGREFTVKIAVASISQTLHTVEYELHYDSTVLELITPADEEDALECISLLPDNWENFSGIKSEGVVGVLVLTANLGGLKDGELEFLFRFRVKDGAAGETTVSIPEETVCGATVDAAAISEYGGNGGSAVITLDNGSVGSVSAIDESVAVSEVSEESQVEEPEEEIGGISVTVWVILSVLVAALIGYAAYSVKFKKKK